MFLKGNDNKLGAYKCLFKFSLFVPQLAVAQFYATEVHNLYVIKGNSGILKCEMPSFVADFLHIVAWIDETETSYVYTSKSNNGQTFHTVI